MKNTPRIIGPRQHSATLLCGITLFTIASLMSARASVLISDSLARTYLQALEGTTTPVGNATWNVYGALYPGDPNYIYGANVSPGVVSGYGYRTTGYVNFTPMTTTTLSLKLNLNNFLTPIIGQRLGSYYSIGFFGAGASPTFLDQPLSFCLQVIKTDTTYDWNLLVNDVSQANGNATALLTLGSQNTLTFAYNSSTGFATGSIGATQLFSQVINVSVPIAAAWTTSGVAGNDAITSDFALTSIPEPSSVALVLMGVIALFGFRRFRLRHQA